VHLLNPTPGFGVDTMTCSYCGAEAYPRTNLGRPVDLNWEATRAVDLNACILCDIVKLSLGNDLARYRLHRSSRALELSG
jgi:hypothetical protein